MKKTLTWLAAASAVAIGLAGCSAGSTGGSGGEIGEAGDESISGTVTYWHAYSADSPEIETLEEVVIPAFEEQYPDVTVESVPVPYDDLRQKLITGVAGDALPDLVRSDIIWVPELAELGVLVPLDEQMPDFQEYADQVFEGPLATNRWDGSYYGLPLDTNTRVLMYNQAALDAAGVEVPETFDDLRAAADAVTANGGYLFADNGTSGWNVLPWIWSAGGDVTDEDVTTATGHLDSDASVEGVQLLVDLYQQGAIPELITGAEGGTPTSDGLPTGEYATILDGPWMFPIFESQYPDFDLQTAQVPAGDGGSISVVGGESIVLTESSENKAAAAEFMRYLLSEEAQLAFAEVGQMPVLADLGEELVEIRDYYAPFVTQLETAKPRTPTPAWPKMEEVLKTNIAMALQGEMSVEDALSDAATQIDALLAQYQN